MPGLKRVKADNIEAEFRKAFSELLVTIEKDENIKEYNFRGFRFPSINLEKKLFTKPMSCYRARFSGEANFYKATFEDSVDFHESVFNEDIRFSGATFKGNVLFLDTSFPKTVSFEGTIFETKAVFMKCLFDGYPTQFSHAIFNNGAEFRWVTFKSSAAFHKATFDQDTVFEGEYSHPGCFEVGGEFASLRLRKDATILFDHVDLSQMTFLDTDLERIRFRGVMWYSPPGRPHRKRALWDEFRPQVSERTYPHVAENYAQLVINYEKSRDYNAAEDFHIGEMEMRRKTVEAQAKRHKLRKHISHINTYSLYRFLSTYGTSYWRALGVFAGLFLLCSLVFLFTGLQGPKGAIVSVIDYRLSPDFSFAGALHFFADYFRSIAFTFSAFTFQREYPYKPLGIASHIWQGFASLLLAGQAALILLAIRRQFKR